MQANASRGSVNARMSFGEIRSLRMPVKGRTASATNENMPEMMPVVIDPLILEAMPQDLRVPKEAEPEIADEELGREAA